VEVPSASSDDWKAVWKLNVPPKTCVFWWRVLHGFLPTRHKLHRGHVERVANCETCGAPEETIKHALLDCTVARCFWDRIRSLTGVKVPRFHDHDATWARDLLQPSICPARDVAMILCGMWSLWTSRNERRHGTTLIPVWKAVQWARDTAYDLWHLLHPVKDKQKEICHR
jgi:hypothetical protein